MEKNEVMAMTVAATITILMIGLTRVNAYVEAMNNWLFLIFAVIVMILIGYGIANLFYTKKKEEKFGK